jgi:hypothetical protein
MAWEVGWMRVGLMGGRDMRLRDGFMYCGLVRIIDFFFLVLFFVITLCLGKKWM